MDPAVPVRSVFGTSNRQANSTVADGASAFPHLEPAGPPLKKARPAAAMSSPIEGSPHDSSDTVKRLALLSQKAIGQVQSLEQTKAELEQRATSYSHQIQALTDLAVEAITERNIAETMLASTQTSLSSLRKENSDLFQQMVSSSTEVELMQAAARQFALINRIMSDESQDAGPAATLKPPASPRLLGSVSPRVGGLSPRVAARPVRRLTSPASGDVHSPGRHSTFSPIAASPRAGAPRVSSLTSHRTTSLDAQSPGPLLRTPGPAATPAAAATPAVAATPGTAATPTGLLLLTGAEAASSFRSPRLHDPLAQHCPTTSSTMSPMSRLAMSNSAKKATLRQLSNQPSHQPAEESPRPTGGLGVLFPGSPTTPQTEAPLLADAPSSGQRHVLADSPVAQAALRAAQLACRAVGNPPT